MSIKKLLTIAGVVSLAAGGVHLNDAGAGPDDLAVRGNAGSRSGGILSVTNNDTIMLNISLDAGDQAGNTVEWWMLGRYEDEGVIKWYYYDTRYRDWRRGIIPTGTGSLGDLEPRTLLVSKFALPGEYTFYFGVDPLVNGSPDLGVMVYDYVDLDVAPYINEDEVYRLNLSYDWGCLGEEEKTYWDIAPDGSFTDEWGGEGVWTQTDDQVDFQYTSGEVKNTEYIGTIIDDADVYIEGTMMWDNNANDSGCWTASKIEKFYLLDLTPAP